MLLVACSDGDDGDATDAGGTGEQTTTTLGDPLIGDGGREPDVPVTTVAPVDGETTTTTEAGEPTTTLPPLPDGCTGVDEPATEDLVTWIADDELRTLEPVRGAEICLRAVVPGDDRILWSADGSEVVLEDDAGVAARYPEVTDLQAVVAHPGGGYDLVVGVADGTQGLHAVTDDGTATPLATVTGGEVTDVSASADGITLAVFSSEGGLDLVRRLELVPNLTDGSGAGAFVAVDLADDAPAASASQLLAAPVPTADPLVVLATRGSCTTDDAVAVRIDLASGEVVELGEGRAAGEFLGATLVHSCDDRLLLVDGTSSDTIAERVVATAVRRVPDPDALDLASLNLRPLPG